ncbi:MAG: hypothetical protein WC683_02705 [bacterium]
MSRPSYKTHDPKGWCGDPKRGAAMGRGTWEGPPTFSGKITLRKVRMSADGAYDENGTYFGFGTPIYWFANDDCTIDGTLRAKSREDARNQVLAMYPKAKFFR